MRKLLLYLLAIFVFYACSKDKDNYISNIADNSLIVGEWVTENHSSNGFTDITLFENLRVEMALVQDSVGRKAILQEDIGSWVNSNDVLSFTMLNNNISRHKIIELNNDLMKLRNLRYNTIDTYYHVVETIEMDAGHKSQIKYLQNHSDFTATELISGNPDIATISKEGIVRAHQGGITFIRMSSYKKTIFVKVKVRSRIEVYSNETQLKFSDINMKLGEPDQKTESNDKEFDVFMYYGEINETLKGKLSDNGITIVQYFVDKETDEVVKINTLYTDIIPLKSDWAYIQEYYYPIKNTIGNRFFGKYEYRSENSVLLYPYNDDDGDPWISYNNNSYFSSDR